MPLNVVLLNPEIPNNTGNIGRLCLATNTKLHLIKPLGFEINDKRLKRAGLDYWQHLEVNYYENIEDFFIRNKNCCIHFFTSKAVHSVWDIKFQSNDFLFFGKESVGLPDSVLKPYPNNCFKIPMYNPNIRSLNLANAVSIVIYEGLRQLSN